MSVRMIRATAFLAPGAFPTKGGTAITRNFPSRRRALEFAMDVSQGTRWVDEGPLEVKLEWHGARWDWWFINGRLVRHERQLWGSVR